MGPDLIIVQRFYGIPEMSGTIFYNTEPCKTKWQKIKNRLRTCLNLKKKKNPYTSTHLTKYRLTLGKSITTAICLSCVHMP